MGRIAPEIFRKRLLIEGYYYHRTTVEKLAEQSGRTVASTYKALQRVRQSLQLCIEGTTTAEGAM